MIAILGLLWGGASSFLTSLFAFVTKPPGSYVAAAGLAALAWWYSGHLGYGRGQDACEAAHKAAAQAEVHRQAVVGVTVTKAAEVRSIVSQKADRSNREVVAHVKEQAHVAPQANAVCVPADLADGLRDLH